MHGHEKAESRLMRNLGASIDEGLMREMDSGHCYHVGDLQLKLEVSE